MRNSFLAPLPSQILSFGNSDFRMPSADLDITSALDGKLNINSHIESLWSLPKLFKDEEEMRVAADFGFDNFQPVVIPQTGYRDISSNVHTEQTQEQSKKRRVLTSEALNAKKRLLEAKEHKSATEEEEETDITCEWKKNKRKRVPCSAQQFPPRAERNPINVSEIKVTVKRSQKIGDKITALQKLVSPYGKTDTASVLQEASLYIKLLQEQIQNLFQMLSSSYNSIRPLQLQENGKRQTDLRSRGLCLVPVSSIQEVTKET